MIGRAGYLRPGAAIGPGHDLTCVSVTINAASVQEHTTQRRKGPCSYHASERVDSPEPLAKLVPTATAPLFNEPEANLRGSLLTSARWITSCVLRRACLGGCSERHSTRNHDRTRSRGQVGMDRERTDNC